MKKLAALLIAIVLVMSISLTAFAAPAGFVSSPSGKPGPSISSSTPDEDCDGNVILTPYSERDKLPDDQKKQLEDAYNSITSNASDLSKLTSELEKIIKDKNIPAGNLGASDLFKLSTNGCNEHNGNHLFDITLKPETLKDFVALLRYDGQKWVVVTDAKVNGDHLTFSSPAMNTYAIITGAADTTSPKTNDTSVMVYAIIMIASASLAVFIFKKSAKTVA